MAPKSKQRATQSDTTNHPRLLHMQGKFRKPDVGDSSKRIPTTKTPPQKSQQNPTKTKDVFGLETGDFVSP